MDPHKNWKYRIIELNIGKLERLEVEGGSEDEGKRAQDFLKLLKYLDHIDDIKFYHVEAKTGEQYKAIWLFSERKLTIASEGGEVFDFQGKSPKEAFDAFFKREK